MDPIKQQRLTELYHLSFGELRQLRSNMQKTFFGFVTFFTVFMGWFIVSNSSFTLNQKLGLTVVIISVFLVFFYGWKVMKQYFLKTGKIVNSIDKLYGFYKPNEYINEDILLPKEWKCFGKKGFAADPFFSFAQKGLIILTILAIVSVWIF